jgi:hypothetical protein
MEERLLEEIGQERQTESTLHKGELQFRRLLEKPPAAAYTCDPEGLITYFSEHAVQLWGRAPQLNDPKERYCGSHKLFSPDGSPIPHNQCWMALALVLSANLDREETARAVERGAAGVRHKSATFEEVVNAVRRLRAGEPLLPLDEVVELLRFASSRR